MALRLVWVSVVFGIGSGAMAVITGLANHSLSVLAAGLGVLADVTGSATPDWRFRAERRQPGRSQAAEARATIVVAAALAVGSRPGTSGVTLAAAAVSLVVLTPWPMPKRRLGVQMASRACKEMALSAASAPSPACWRSPCWSGTTP